MNSSHCSCQYRRGHFDLHVRLSFACAQREGEGKGEKEGLAGIHISLDLKFRHIIGDETIDNETSQTAGPFSLLRHLMILT